MMKQFHPCGLYQYQLMIVGTLYSPLLTSLRCRPGPALGTGGPANGSVLHYKTVEPLVKHHPKHFFLFLLVLKQEWCLVKGVLLEI